MYIFLSYSCIIVDIILAAGGRFCSGLPKSSSKPSDDTVIISCPEDNKIYKPLLQSGHNVVNKEFILTGVLRQKLEPKLFSLC